MSVSLALLSICICWFGCVFQICSACGFGFAAEFKSLTILLCFPNLLRLRSQIWKRVTFALFVRISAMQIIGSGQIVTFVTSVVPTFFCCIALFIFSFCFSFYYFACSVRMRWGVSPLRRRPRALPFGFPQAFEKA